MEFIHDEIKPQIDYWTKEGYLHENINYSDISVLVTLLSNQKKFFSTYEDKGYLKKDIVYKTIVKMWKYLESKLFVHVSAMVNPTDKFYYIKKENGQEIVDAMKINAISRYFKRNVLFELGNNPKNQHFGVCDDSFATKKVNNFCDVLPVSESCLIDYNAKLMAKEIDNEIVMDLWNNSEIIHSFEDMDLTEVRSEKTDYIITNEIGRSFFAGIIDKKIYINPNINGIIYGSSKFVDQVYFYHIYVPVSEISVVMDNKGNLHKKCLTRYSKKLIKNKSNLFKIVF